MENFLGKSEREYDDYDGINFRTDKRSKNRFIRKNVKNILKNIDLNLLDEDVDPLEELENNLNIS